jgi:exodeoxyribonuclease V alpha subunit
VTSVTGSVDRVVFHNPETGFCVARFQVVDDGKYLGAATTIVGTMPAIKPGEMLRLEGEWQTHPVHGRNFRVEWFEQEMPTSVEGIERYLASGAIAGVGPVTAGRIVEAFGTAAIEILDTNPDLLRQVAGINARRLKIIVDSWNEQKRIRDLSMFLQSHGISVALASRIYAKYGDNAVSVISTDPYQLAREIHGIGFRTADAVATKLGMSKRSASRYAAGLLYTLSEGADSGHIFLPREELLSGASRLLDAASQELEPSLLELSQRGDAVLDGDRIYLAAFHTAEEGTVRALAALATTPSALLLDRSFDPGAAIARAAQHQGIVLAEMQLRAAEGALRRKVSILTGGPGTGKTSTLRTIIDALEHSDITFCLCAPTGRAAKRVAETTGRGASTIHRLLEFQPATNSFGYDRSRPLPYDFIVVDEVSMLDQLLCYHLLKAVPPESHVLFVGDADQLPSVGPGNVLRDLLDSEAIETVTLVDLFRQARGSRIILAAHAINEGKLPDLTPEPSGDFHFVRAANENDVVRAIVRLVGERIPHAFGLDPVEDVQVLSPMHAGPAGVASLNTELQALLNPRLPGCAELHRGDRTFREGDKVMQIRNNYDKEIYNGDIGRVTEIDSADNALMVEFPSAAGPVEVDYESADLDELVLAYAVSVHKAQGSEFPCIVMPIVPRHTIMLQRNLVYTAVTRARRLCVLVGSESALARAAATQHRRPRHTALRERVAASLPHVAQPELV